MLAHLLVLVGLLAVTGTVACAATLLVARWLPADASHARRSVVKRIVIAFSHLIGIAGIVLTGVWEPVLDAIVHGAPPLDPSVAGIGVFVLGSVVALPGTVCAHLLTGFQQVNAEGSGSPRRLLSLAARDAFGLTIFLGVAVVAFVGMVAAPHPAIAAVVPIPATFLGAQILTYGVLWAQPLRGPTAEERERIERALAETGFPMQRVHVVEDQPEVELPRPFVRGLWVGSHVFVPEDSLETMEPAVFETTLVQLTTSSGFRPVRIVTRSLLIGVPVTMFLHLDALALYTAEEPESLPILLVLTVALVLNELLALVIGHRLIYRADQRVANVVGAEQLRTAMQRQFERSGGEEIDRLARYLLLLPSVEQRLEQLRAEE